MGLSREKAFALGLIPDGKGGWVQAKKISTSENQIGQPVELESELHEQINSYCKAKGWGIVHSRMDKRPTIDEGLPDFIIAANDGVTLWVEAKARSEKAKVKQLGWAIHLQALKHKYCLVRNFQQFVDFVETSLDIR